MPDGVIWSVAFSTTHYGSAPKGEAQACYTSSGGCGYDSLNVGAFSAANAPYVGTDVNEDQAFVCRQDLLFVTTCSMESGWTGYRPLGSISATK